MTHANDTLIGRQLQDYVIEARLGKGGMGTVYRARDVKLDRPVALKVLPPELMRDPDRRRRFVQEARAASAVNHPAIAQIYTIEEEGDVPFIAMEHVDGATIRQLVDRGELDVLSAVEIGIQVAEALARAHEAGIIHRDIKSDNIMVTRDGHPKILDFGLAKLLDVGPAGSGATGADGAGAGAGAEAAADPSALETVALTQAGVVLGTVAYMSPEQARGLPVDHRSDVFSFGIVLYEMATGRRPFSGQSALDTMHEIAYGQTQPIRALRADLPASLQRVVDRCLRKEPEARYADLRAAATDLRHVKREIESGVTTSWPILEKLRALPHVLPGAASNWTTRGILVVGIWTLILGGLAITALGEGGGLGSTLPFVVFGLFVFAHVRGRNGRLVKRFVKKASKLREVQLVGYLDGTFTVAARQPKAATYVKLNALLEEVNAKRYFGPPFVLKVLEDVELDEVKSLAMHSGVRFMRDAR